MTKAVLLFVAFVMCEVDPCSAQNPESEPPRFKSQVVVTPERGSEDRDSAPTATTVLSATEIATKPSVYPGETIRELPGFHVSRGEFYTGANPVVSSRGFFGGGEADYILLLLDGMPAYDIESGLVDWSALTATSIERIESFRGPGASSYGDSAVGGVIQLLTDRTRTGGRVTMSVGSFESLTADGEYIRRAARYGLTFNGAARTTSGFTSQSDARHLIGGGTLDGRIDGIAWRATATAQNRHNGNSGALLLTDVRRDPRAADALSAFDYVDRNGYLSSLSLDRSGTVWVQQARLNVRGRSENQVRTILLAPGFPDRDASVLSSLGISGSFDTARRFGSNLGGVVRFGIDLASEGLETTYAPVSATGAVEASGSSISGRRLRSGVFGSAGWLPWARIRVSGALRLDRIRDTTFAAGDDHAPSHNAWSPKVGVSARLTETGNLVAFSQGSRAFKVATLDQLFDPRNFPDGGGGSFTISNPLLQPQRATSYEAGLHGTLAGRFRWSALAYSMNVDNEIDFDIRTFSYSNIGESRHSGAEVEVSALPLGSIRPSVSYIFSGAHETGRREQLKNVPRHVISLGATVKLPFRTDAHVRFRAVRGLYADDGNAIALRGASTFDIRVRRQYGRHAVFFDALNLANQRYEEFGFSLADFRGNPVAYAYAGAPRGVRAGVTLDVGGSAAKQP